GKLTQQITLTYCDLIPSLVKTQTDHVTCGFWCVLKMQEVGCSQQGSQRAFSVLDRLLLTHPVWLQLSLNQDSALYILLREPVGVSTDHTALNSDFPLNFPLSNFKVRENLALERAMFTCVLRPLKSLLDQALVMLHIQDGSNQRLSKSLLQLKGDRAMEHLGVQTGVPDSRDVERVKQKLIMMQRTYSPIDKVLLLLQVCKCVQKAMGSLHGQPVSWEDFLPSLSYVMVECNRPHILIDVEYMMELLEPSWLCGEGGYYLTSVYASLRLIQSLEGDQPPPAGLTQEAQEALREWGCRRNREAQRHKENQQTQVRGSLVEFGSTLLNGSWCYGNTSQALAQLCADTFGVSDPQQYTLYWRSGGEMRALPPQAQPQDLASHSEGGPSLSYLRTDHDFSKMRRLTRGGAVDLSESVCEE
uniref:Si:ch211-168d1.3 n=1 Tax=Myripristis murdjan TaxID=586833 RepID=A0A667XH00_9TELE